MPAIERSIRVVCVCTFLFLLASACAQKANTEPPEFDPTGFYLAEGGHDYLEITRNASGELAVKRSANAQQVTIRAGGGRLVISEIRGPVTDSKTFEPSKTIPGGWDLVQHQVTGLPDGNPVALAKPIPSYLHRVDASVREYYDLYDAAETSGDATALAENNKKMLDLVNRLVAKYPEDPFLKLLRFDALIRNNAGAELQQELARDGAAMRKLDNPYINAGIEYAANSAKSLQTDTKTREQLRQILSMSLDQQWALLQSLPDNFNYADFSIAETMEKVPNFLGFQTFVRTMRTRATMEMLVGNREESLKALAGICMLSQSMIQQGTLVNRLIGIAGRAISVGGLEIYALNVSDSPKDLEQLWAAIERINAAYTQPTEEGMFSAEHMASINFYHSAQRANLAEAYTRLKVSDAQFQNLRLATAARMRMLTTDKFPANNSEFGPYLTAGPSPDPFASAPLKIISTPEKFTAYSIGPDEKDDRAQITYDPTNGTLSAGDVILEVPRARKYPVPPNGLRGLTPADIARQMPNDLPADPFAITKGSPLNVAQTSTSLVIFSWGPDMNGPRNPDEIDNNGRIPDSAPPVGPDIQYDPTNGTTSRGDLIVPVPK